MKAGRRVGRAGTSLVEVLVSMVLLGLAWTLTVRVLTDASRNLDDAERGFRSLVEGTELEVETVPPDTP